MTFYFLVGEDNKLQLYLQLIHQSLCIYKMNAIERQQFNQHLAALNCFANVDLNMQYEQAVHTLECINSTLRSLQCINDEHLITMRQYMHMSDSSSNEREDNHDDVSSLLSVSQTGNDAAEEYFIDVINDISVISDEPAFHKTVASKNESIASDKTVNLMTTTYPTRLANENALAMAQSRLLDDTYAQNYTIPYEQERGYLEEDEPIHPNITVRNRTPFYSTTSDSDEDNDTPVYPNITVSRHMQSRYL